MIRLCAVCSTALAFGCSGLLAGEPPTAQSLEDGAKNRANEAAREKADEATANALDASGANALKARADAASARALSLGASPAQAREFQAAEQAHAAHMAAVPRGSRWSKARKRAREQTAAEPLILDLWRQGMIRCGKDRCEDLYWIHVPAQMRIVVEANGPAESGQPDFGLSLLDGELEVLNLNRAARIRPRTIDEPLAPGIHYVKIFAFEKSGEQLSYQVRARRYAAADAHPLPAAAQGSAPQTRPRSAPKPQSAPPATPDLVSLRSEVLEIERSGDVPVAVLIEAGIARGVRAGMRGELVDRGRVIARIEIVQTYSAGSRARIVGALTGEPSQDTTARIYLPAD